MKSIRKSVLFFKAKNPNLYWEIRMSAAPDMTLNNLSFRFRVERYEKGRVCRIVPGVTYFERTIQGVWWEVRHLRNLKLGYNRVPIRKKSLFIGGLFSKLVELLVNIDLKKSNNSSPELGNMPFLPMILYIIIKYEDQRKHWAGNVLLWSFLQPTLHIFSPGYVVLADCIQEWKSK